MKTWHILYCLFALIVFVPATMAGTDLRVSADGHRLEQTNGTPLFLLSDTEWLLNRHTDARVLQLLDDRKAKGFTAVQVFATHSWTTQTDLNGQMPFINNDVTRLNASYWHRWNWICDQAAQRGLHFILVMGEPIRSDRTWQVTSSTAAYEYGRQVAAVFANKPNVIFSQGYDSTATTGTAYTRAMAEGVADGVNGVNAYDGQANYATTMQTYHGYSISATFHNDAWIDFYGPEVWHNNSVVYGSVLSDYNLGAPVKPTFLMEGSYEDERFSSTNPALISADYVRAEAWFSVMGSCMGYGYGHYNNWSQTSSLAYLDDDAAKQMAVMAKFVTSHAWDKWRPDATMVASAGSGSSQVVAVRSTTGDECVVYFPVNVQKTLNLAHFTAAANVQGIWMDPRSGNEEIAGLWAASGTRAFTPPTGWVDAVLVLRAPAVPEPGTLTLLGMGGLGLLAYTWRRRAS